MRSLKILLLTTFFPPLNSIASLRPASFAKYWSQKGHQVTVVTTKKREDFTETWPIQCIEISLPTWFESLKNKHKQSSTTSKNSWIEKIRSRFGIFQACRMPDISYFWAKKAWKQISKGPSFDIVVSTAGPYTTHVLAYQMKRSGLAKKWFADYRDLWSDNHIYPGLFPFNLYERYLEQKILRLADGITTVSSPLANTLKALTQTPIHVIENGFDEDDLFVLPSQKFFPEDGRFRMVYTGSLYPGKVDPSLFFQALQRLDQKQPIEVLFFGERLANLDELIRKYQVSHFVKNCGAVSREQALLAQRDANLLLFFPWSDDSQAGIVTGKIFEYLFSQTPILSIGRSSLDTAQQLILNCNAGFVLHDIPQIQQTILHCLAAPKKKRTPNLEQLTRYQRKYLAEKMLALIEQTISHSN